MPKTKKEQKIKVEVDLEMVLDNIPAFIFYKDTKNNILKVNDYFASMMKMKKNDMEGKSCWDLWPEMGDKYFIDDKKLFKSGKSLRNIIEPIATPNGNIWLKTDKILIKKDGKNAGIIGFSVDITKEIETANALEKSQERFDLAMKGSEDGLWDWDIEIGKVYYSPRWKSILGYKESEISDSFDEFARLVHPDDIDRVSKYVNNYVKSDGKGQFEIEFKMKHKKGHDIYILARAFSVRDEKGKLARLVGTHVDISQRKKAENSLVDKIKELEKLNKIMIDRELKMIDLKSRIKELENKNK